MAASFLALAALVPLTMAAQAPVFAPPSTGPTVQTANYTGFSNGSLPASTIVPGATFDRFIQVWLENTDYATAASSPVFQNLSTQGILLSQYYAVTHPSEPNYVAVVGGDFWGMGDDAFYNIPSNISTIVDVLEAKNISWASYQESMPYDGYIGYNYTQDNYLNASAPPYTYYVRKHSPTLIYDSVASVPERLARHRNFNDFAVDVGNNTLPQWIFVTPNLVNDAHDTTVDFAGQWLQYWLIPLLSNPNFNNNRTLIILTFDENETYTVGNNVYTVLLGGVVPTAMKGTTDSTYYSHYSCMSTVQANWKLGSVGRGDVNKTMSNVFSFMASAVNYTNENVTGAAIPMTNLTGNIPGPLNKQYYLPFTAPLNLNATGAGGGKVFIASNLNTTLTSADVGAPVNLTAEGIALVPAGTTSMAYAPPVITTGSAGAGAASAAAAPTSAAPVSGSAAVSSASLAGSPSPSAAASGAMALNVRAGVVGFAVAAVGVVAGVALVL